MSVDDSKVTTVEALEELYGTPINVALTKELPALNAPYRKLIEASPFVLVATSGPEGLDCSPRGDPAGFVRVVDESTVLMPDRRGNNRLDTLKNIVRDPRIALLFLIPGVNETLRINGDADVLTDPELCASFELQGKAPKTVIRVNIKSVYFQCPKALVRSRLWDPASQVERASLPSSGDMLQAATKGEVEGSQWDEAYPERMKQTIY